MGDLTEWSRDYFNLCAPLERRTAHSSELNRYCYGGW